MAGTLFSKAVISFDLNAAGALQQLNTFQQKFASGVGQMKSMIASFIGFQGLRGAYQGLVDIVDVANKWNIPVEKVSQFANLFTQFGGSASEATASLEKFQQMANQLQFHSSGPLRELSAVLRTNLANKDYMGVIKALRGQWGQLNDNARAEVQNMLGLDSDAMRRMLAASDQEFAEAVQKSEKLGKITAENAKTLQDMRVAVAETKQALMMAVMPVLEAIKPLLDVVRDLAIAFGNLDPRVRKIIGIIAIGLPMLKSIVGLLGTGLKGAILGVKSAGALLMGGLILDTFPAFYQAIKDAISGTKDLDQILSDMAKKSYVINVVLKIANGIGEGIANFAESLKRENAVDRLLGNKNLRHNDVGQIGAWLQDNKDADNYAAVKKAFDEYNRSWAIKRRQELGMPLHGDIPQTDNRTYNLTFNGIQNPNDFITAFRQVATDNMSPIQGY